MPKSLSLITKLNAVINLNTATFLFISLLPSMAVFSTPATAQDAECFMVTSSGRVMNLNNLCEGSKEVFFQAPIKRREHGIPIIDVTFNGKRTFEMLVDTGASKTVITQQMAAILGIFPIGTTKADTASEKGINLFIGRMTSIEAAGAVVRNTLVGISPILDTGLLGQDLLSSYNIAIKKNVVEFRAQ